MNKSSSIKERLLPYFLHRLQQSGVPQPCYPDELMNASTVHYIPPGQRIEQPIPCLFFLAHGLLKEYYRNGRSLYPSTLVQLLMPDDIWLYNQSAYKFRTRTLMPSWLLQIPMEQLYCIVKSPHKLRSWLSEQEMIYAAKHCLSDFIQQQSNRDERIHLFLEEYGPYIDYLSNNEIRHYTGLDDAKIDKLRNRAFLYQRFD
jgi:hypothetical protein